MNLSGVARQRIVANFAVMVATAAGGLLGFGIRYSLDLDSADAA
jgi:hypothetical protein